MTHSIFGSMLLCWLQETAAETQPVTMQPLGWAFMIISLTFVVGLVLFCYARLLTLPTDPAEELEDEE